MDETINDGDTDVVKLAVHVYHMQASESVARGWYFQIYFAGNDLGNDFNPIGPFETQDDARRAGEEQRERELD